MGRFLTSLQRRSLFSVASVAGFVLLALCVWPGVRAGAQPPAEETTTASLIEQAFRTPAPAVFEQAPGRLVFEGVYRHKSHGEVIGLEHRWMKQQGDDSVAIACELAFAKTLFYAEGGRLQGFTRYEVQSSGGGAYSLKMEMATGQVVVTRRGLRENWDRKEFAVPARALFEPNSERDPYCAAQAMGYLFDITLRSPEETEVYDWDSTGDDLAYYRTRIRNAGLEEVTVPSGRFRGYHYVIEHVTSANTGFRKSAGDITDIWELSGMIARVVRNSDQYEVDLLEWKTMETLPDIVEKFAPILNDTSVPPPTIASQRLPLNEADRIKGCWTLQGFVMPYRAAVYLTPLRGESGGPNDLGVGTGEHDCRIVFRDLPKNPKPAGEVKIGDYEKGEVIPFCMKSTWRGQSFWASTSEDTHAARGAFQDTDGSLGGQTAVEQIGPDRWLMQLDGANSYKYDDDDNDLPVLLRLEKQ